MLLRIWLKNFHNVAKEDTQWHGLAIKFYKADCLAQKVTIQSQSILEMLRPKQINQNSPSFSATHFGSRNLYNSQRQKYANHTPGNTSWPSPQKQNSHSRVQKIAPRRRKFYERVEGEWNLIPILSHSFCISLNENIH